MNNQEHSKTEKVIYTTLGGFIILKLAPIYIPYCMCFGGLMVSLYGILDVINKSDSRDAFDIKKHIENINK